MILILILACLAWTAFTIAYYRSAIKRKLRNQRYAEYAQVVFNSVGEFFPELKHKSQVLVKDLGFGKYDESAWHEEVIKFINLVVFPRISKGNAARIKGDPDENRTFSTLAFNFVLDLMCYANIPNGYDLDEVIASIEDQDDSKNLLSGKPVFRKGKDLVIRYAVLVLAVGALASNESVYAGNGESFSPLDACNALAEEQGFEPDGYSELYDDVYSCGTLYKITVGGTLPNNFSMYGRGNKTEVTRVRLMLNVNQQAYAARDTKELGRLCEKMVTNLIGSAPEGFANKVAAGRAFELTHGGYRLILERKNWPTGKGYELNCVVATPNHKE